jgi:hypothetical protein
VREEDAEESARDGGRVVLSVLDVGSNKEVQWGGTSSLSVRSADVSEELNSTTG